MGNDVIIIEKTVPLDELVQMSPDMGEQILDAIKYHVNSEILPEYELTEDDVDTISSSVVVMISLRTTVPWPGPIEKKG
jgi:hypothetical protein